MTIDGKAIKAVMRGRHPYLKAGSTLGRFSPSCRVVKAVDENGGFEFETIITTEAVDAENEVVVAKGGRFDYFKANKSVFADHEYGLGDVVGKCRWIRPEPATATNAAGWRMRVRLLNSSPYAAMVRELVELDSIGASVGIEAYDVGPPTPEEAKAYPGARSIVRSWNAFEVSLTPLPMNVECQSDTIVPVAKHRRIIVALAKAGRLTKTPAPARRIIVCVRKGT